MRNAAVRLLAAREHSTAELTRKLSDRGFAPSSVNAALEALAREGLLSDERYAESYARYRAGRGFGPQRIRAEMRERGVDDETAKRALSALDVCWETRAREVRVKRFGGGGPRDLKDRLCQVRFLQYRGFTHEQIQAAMGAGD